MRPAPLAAAAALAIDEILGDRTHQWDPVAWFESAMETTERLTYSDDRGAGILYTSIGVLGSVTVAGAADMTIFWTSMSLGGAELDSVAAAVEAALQSGDLTSARALLRGLVARDTGDLDEAEIARATVESLAKNSVDKVIAPLFWAAVLGSTGVVIHRAAHTMDAMVGYHTDRYENFGWASARLDDVLSYLPARAAVLMVCVVRPARARAVAETVMSNARQHRSPNKGHLTSAFAAALDIQLGGANSYGDQVVQDDLTGTGDRPTVHSIATARVLRRDLSIAFGVGCIIAGLIRRAVNAHVRP